MSTSWCLFLGCLLKFKDINFFQKKTSDARVGSPDWKKGAAMFVLIFTILRKKFILKESVVNNLLYPLLKCAAKCLWKQRILARFIIKFLFLLNFVFNPKYSLGVFFSMYILSSFKNNSKDIIAKRKKNYPFKLSNIRNHFFYKWNFSLYDVINFWRSKEKGLYHYFRP